MVDTVWAATLPQSGLSSGCRFQRCQWSCFDTEVRPRMAVHLVRVAGGKEFSQRRNERESGERSQPIY